MRAIVLVCRYCLLALDGGALQHIRRIAYVSPDVFYCSFVLFFLAWLFACLSLRRSFD
jgi:hypothetical protein